MLKPRRSFTLRERRLFKEGNAHLAKHGFHKYGLPINTRQGRRRRVLARKAFPPLPSPKPHMPPARQTFPDAERTDPYALQSIYWGVFTSCGRRVPRRSSLWKPSAPWRLAARKPTVLETGPLENAVPRWRNICNVSHENLRIYGAWLDTG